MSEIKAREALKYALSRELLKLYGLLLLADLSVISGAWISANWAMRGGTAGIIGQIFGPALLLIGFILGVVGIVAFIYKVLTDANRAAE